MSEDILSFVLISALDIECESQQHRLCTIGIDSKNIIPDVCSHAESDVFSIVVNSVQ